MELQEFEVVINVVKEVDRICSLKGLCVPCGGVWILNLKPWGTSEESDQRSDI